MRRSSILTFLGTALLGTAAFAQDLPTFPTPPADEPSSWFREPNVGYGPFHYVSMALFPSLRSGFETNFPSSMASGRFDLRVTESRVTLFRWPWSDAIRNELGARCKEPLNEH